MIRRVCSSSHFSMRAICTRELRPRIGRGRARSRLQTDELRRSMTEETAQSRLAELEADNQRLRRLLDQKGAPSELRHRLRNALAMLRVIVRQSAETNRDIADY